MDPVAIEAQGVIVLVSDMGMLHQTSVVVEDENQRQSDSQCEPACLSLEEINNLVSK